MHSQNELLFLALNRITFLRPREKLLLADLLGSLQDLVKFGRKDLVHCLGRSPRARVWQPEDYARLAECDKKYLTKANIKYTFYREEDYPAPLAEIYDPPLVLYYRGGPLRRKSSLAAVVGTRQPSEKALMRAYSLGVEFGAARIGVVSGLARGIDTAVHKGCLSIGGPAIAVMGNGIDMVYPASSKSTAAKILEQGGCLVSEYPPGVLPQKYHFPERNRIISGLAAAVVVIEAPRKSGALITADFALEQGRELFVHKAGLEGITGEGTRLLHEQGAEVIDNAYPVIKELRGNPGRPVLAGGKNSGLRFEVRGESGRALAHMLELELEEKLSVYNGEYYRSE